MNIKFGVMFLFGVVLSGWGYANPNLEPHPLVGSWKLVSWIITNPSGEARHPMGKSPEGRLIYTINGQMSAHLINPNASLPNTSGLSKEEVMGYVYKMAVSYYGPYSVNESEKTVTHHVKGSSVTFQIGKDQLREYKFLNSNQIQLIAKVKGNIEIENAGFTGTSVLVWTRIH